MNTPAANTVPFRPTLGTVALPFVRLMKDANLSWLERAQISDAVQAILKHWNDMGDEANALAQRSCAAALPTPGSKLSEWGKSV